MAPPRRIDTEFGIDNEGPQGVTGDRGILISDDGARRSELLHNVSHKKRRVRLLPENLADSLAKWIPVDDADYTYTEDVDSVSAVPPGTSSSKRKDYASSDNPMSEFPQVQQLFSDEILRHAGLGNWVHAQECAVCNRPLGNSASTFTPCFRCGACGEFLQCHACCLDRHATSPLHVLEEWTGEFWKTRTLRSLGLVYQLGHGGFRCKFPEPVVRTIVVIAESAIHMVAYRFCGCALADSSNNLCQLLRNAWFPATMTDPDTCATFSVLDLFRLLNVEGDVNVHDFIGALERKTNALAASGFSRVPDRYKAFLRMTRQYAFLQRTRRAGRGHDAAGLAATKAGECMVVCWACPYNGRNLPLKWRDIDAKYGFLYKLILAIDANFKLKNSIRANERYDPSLGPGWGAFVEPQAYRKHLKKYVAEKDISTCIAFAALMQKETRNTAGLRVSGVGGCVCARHECMRPNGLGDLQKGERYANMDYIVMSALRGFDLKELAISYDIACQWEKNLRERLRRLPPELLLDIENIFLQCGLPIWHASAHNKACASENTLNFLIGLGKSDGEGVERLWADLNRAALHTKDMSLGNRADTMEDKVDSHNFLKNLGVVDILRRKLVVAIAERANQVASFKEINKTIKPDVRAQWQKQIDAFAVDHSCPNPYVLSTQDGPTEADIRLELRKEEAKEAASGTAPLHGTSATAFLAAGLQLEDSQRRIRAELVGGTITADREGKVNEHRIAFLAKLRKFRDLQRVYTPGSVRAVFADESQRDPDVPPPKSEDIRLYLPSQLPEAERLNRCQRGVPEMEARLREAQCSDALVQIRARLYAKGHLITFRNENLTGQVQTTRSQTLIAQVGARVAATQRKYNDARDALLTLKGRDYAPHFKKIHNSDLTLDGEERENDADARDRLAKIAAGSGRTARNAPAKNKVLSWIWTARGALDDSEKELHESLRVEWSKAKARKTRWEEEVMLLREEMRRVVRYLDWQSAWWDTQAATADTRSDISSATQQGMSAYARKQSRVHSDLAAFYKRELSQSAGDTVTSVLAAPQEDGADLNEFFSQGEQSVLVVAREAGEGQTNWECREKPPAMGERGPHAASRVRSGAPGSSKAPCGLPKSLYNGEWLKKATPAYLKELNVSKEAFGLFVAATDRMPL
ncbi:hypothetical protein B0H11DRAFT_1918683 [Mycena galericulata]|nr:hypothetical protein B0H11DRAFT_1918683 [Mycena galericulata]